LYLQDWHVEEEDQTVNGLDLMSLKELVGRSFLFK